MKLNIALRPTLVEVESIASEANLKNSQSLLDEFINKLELKTNDG